MADNPQAFPMPASEHSQGGHFEEYGMTLLDYFAGQALAGMLTSPHNDDATPEMYARGAYGLAAAEAVREAIKQFTKAQVKRDLANPPKA